MKKIAILMSVLMLITLTAGVSLAKEKKVAKQAVKLEMLSGEVVNVNAQAGTVVIKANDKEHTLTAQPKLLEGIAAGEKVNIEMTGNVLKSIKKVEAPAIK